MCTFLSHCKVVISLPAMVIDYTEHHRTVSCVREINFKVYTLGLYKNYSAHPGIEPRFCRSLVKSPAQ